MFYLVLLFKNSQILYNQYYANIKFFWKKKIKWNFDWKQWINKRFFATDFINMKIITLPWITRFKYGKTQLRHLSVRCLNADVIYTRFQWVWFLKDVNAILNSSTAFYKRTVKKNCKQYSNHWIPIFLHKF